MISRENELKSRAEKAPAAPLAVSETRKWCGLSNVRDEGVE
jgi:hypothetical protein